MRNYRELVFFGLICLIAIAACFVLMYWQIDISQHHWCDALTTLTAHPVPKPADPAANPSRQEGYVLYQEFLRLKGDFGCG